MPGWIDPWATRGRAKEAKALAEEAEQAALRAELEHLHRLIKDLRIDLALRRLRHKYSSDQPRVSAGSREGGRWIGAFTVPSQQPAQAATASRGTRLAQPGFGQAYSPIERTSTPKLES